MEENIVYEKVFITRTNASQLNFRDASIKFSGDTMIVNKIDKDGNIEGMTIPLSTITKYILKPQPHDY